MLDSGATHHITPLRSDFHTYTRALGTIKIGDKSLIKQEGVRSVIIKSPQGVTITLSNVLYVPGVDIRFMSVRALADKGA